MDHDPIFVRLSPKQKALLDTIERSRFPTFKGGWPLGDGLVFTELADARTFTAWCWRQSRLMLGNQHKQSYEAVARKIENAIQPLLSAQKESGAHKSVYIRTAAEQEAPTCTCGSKFFVVAPGIGWCDSCKEHKGLT
jgi:hypothetical protein